MMRRCYLRWLYGSNQLHDLERGVNITAKTVLRHRTRNNFMKFRAQALALKRKEYIDKKCEWFNQ